MRKTAVLSWVVALSLVLVACQQEKPVPVARPAPGMGPVPEVKTPIAAIPTVEIPEVESRKPLASEEDLAPVVQGNTQFALTLYARLAKKEGNLFFSPHSISTALAMTSAGARGMTQIQMREVLGIPFEEDFLHRCFAELLLQLTEGSGEEAGYQLNVANRLWGQKGLAFRQPFLQVTRDSYGAELGVVDFLKDPEGARGVINDWVAEKTEQRIMDLLAPDTITPITRLVLTNAIYFKGDWASWSFLTSAMRWRC